MRTLNSTRNLSGVAVEEQEHYYNDYWTVSDDVLKVQDILAITLICVGVTAIIPNLLFILSLTQVWSISQNMSIKCI